MLLLTTPTVVSKRRPLGLGLHLPLLKRELPLAKPVLSILTLDHALTRIINDRIQPRRQPEPSLGNLLRNNRNRGIVVRAADLLVAHRVSTIRHHSAAHKRIGIVSPDHRRVDRLLRLQPLRPRLALLLVHPALDLVRQRRSPLLSRREREVPNQLLRDRSVPGSVQVGASACERDVDEVAADFEVLDVQRLVDVADEVDHPFQGFLLLDQTDGFGYCAGGVVGDSGHDAAFLGAVALVVDVALLGGRVQGIDVVQGRAEFALIGVAVAVGLGWSVNGCVLVVLSARGAYPGSHVGEVGSRRIIQDALGKLLGVLRDKVLRNVCYSGMAQRAPSVRRGDSSHAGQDCGLDVNHLETIVCECELMLDE